MKNNKITSRDVDFAAWYTDVVNAAHLARYSNVKAAQFLNQMDVLYGKVLKKTWTKCLKKLDIKMS